MREITLSDLEKSDRLILLFYNAKHLGLVKPCEADKLAFFAAAEHARRVGTQNPCGLFSSIIRNGTFQFVTHAAEDDARKKLSALRESGDAKLGLRC